MSNDSPYADWRIFPLKFALITLGWFKPLGQAVEAIFLSLSPIIPSQLKHSTPPPNYPRLFIVCFIVAFFFCFVVTLGLCYWEGTLYGEDPTRRYFFQDWFNLLLYAFVCPLYVSLCCCIIANCIQGWSDLADYADKISGPSPVNRQNWRIFVVFLIAISLCTLFITNYIHDVLTPDAEHASIARVYWFMRELEGNVRALNRVGYYYVVLNFSLQLFVLIGAACFISMASEVLRVGKVDDVNRIESFKKLECELATFTRGYAFTKGVVATLALNTMIWQLSPLGKTDNLVAAQVLLLVVGIFFVAVPRQFVELKWFELWQTSGQTFNFKDTRPWRTRSLASFLDTIFIGWIISVLGLDAMGVLEAISKIAGE